MGLYEITVDDYKFDAVKLEEFKGKILLIVNSSTKCIFAPQYGKLETLYAKYHKDGFEILTFLAINFQSRT